MHTHTHAHLRKVEHHVRAEHEGTTNLWHRNEAMSIKGQVLGCPDAWMSLHCQVQGQRGEATGVLLREQADRGRRGARLMGSLFRVAKKRKGAGASWTDQEAEQFQLGQDETRQDNAGRAKQGKRQNGNEACVVQYSTVQPTLVRSMPAQVGSSSWSTRSTGSL